MGHYLIALGSNVRHPRHGRPYDVVGEAIMRLEGDGLGTVLAARRRSFRPLGPSRRSYVNTVAMVHSRLPPPAVLARLQAIETAFGRRRRGRRWGARVLDLDIVLWTGGAWRSPGLTVPHPRFRERDFVLLPARELVPEWRDPLSGLTVAQLAARLTRPHPAPTARTRSGP
jgi:2-amino-4-hydroxy-6-hydroxymethyldihydropteridine diphosphokinase